MESAAAKQALQENLLRVQKHHLENLSIAKESVRQLKKFEQDYRTLDEALVALPRNTKCQVLVPFTPLAFMPGCITNTNKLLVLLGENWFVEKTAMAARGVVGRRLRDCREKLRTAEQSCATSAGWFGAASAGGKADDAMAGVLGDENTVNIEELVSEAEYQRQSRKPRTLDSCQLALDRRKKQEKATAFAGRTRSHSGDKLNHSDSSDAELSKHSKDDSTNDPEYIRLMERLEFLEENEIWDEDPRQRSAPPEPENETKSKKEANLQSQAFTSGSEISGAAIRELNSGSILDSRTHMARSDNSEEKPHTHMARSDNSEEKPRTHMARSDEQKPIMSGIKNNPDDGVGECANAMREETASESEDSDSEESDEDLSDEEENISSEEERNITEYEEKVLRDLFGNVKIDLPCNVKSPNSDKDIQLSEDAGQVSKRRISWADLNAASNREVKTDDEVQTKTDDEIPTTSNTIKISFKPTESPASKKKQNGRNKSILTPGVPSSPQALVAMTHRPRGILKKPSSENFLPDGLKSASPGEEETRRGGDEKCPACPSHGEQRPGSPPPKKLSRFKQERLKQRGTAPK